MKAKLYLSLVIILLTFIAKAQESEQWLEMFENPASEEMKLKPENFKSKYSQYDFSTLMVPRSEFLGFIGTDYRRIKMYYSSIVKDESNPERYHVKGASLVKDNKCDFEGTITIKAIREYENLLERYDDGDKKEIVAQGLFIGDYVFKENPKQKHVGTFEGVMVLRWYIDKYGIVHYDDTQFYADGYSNNQYVGTWTMYNTTKAKPCHWGEYRVPMSGDLDQGAGEFVPNPKYFEKGWK
jgi:hypothetical protein